MHGDRRPELVNGYVIYYEPHENQQGSHRISAYDGRIRIAPDGTTTAKNRRNQIRLRLTTIYGEKSTDQAIRVLQGYALGMAGRATDQDRILIRLQDGPFCGTEIPYMNRYAARINELRQAGWWIASRPFCTVHDHRGNQARYRLLEGTTL